MKVVRLLVMLFLKIADNIGMIQLSEDVQLGLKLMALLFGHLGVAYFLPAKYLDAGQYRATTRTRLFSQYSPVHQSFFVLCG